ncbi:ABC transporter substrate-binding protein [Caballeronia sordidicola]|jgi:NitT/TauT family transport system substrate-binding protein|uniref:ABC-type nitrate/sulfonate/bicarbonate transport system periplasmic component n=1 Tax=Caballeronia sordidicola TaxID=196367 RepID=A0A226WQU1_CABSO|nr:ABC transporter substrate-binding protein [Caballeronia sordidicola]OXC73157.1 ABC-type nitrate/sulfonate/bicarbonate transport system periplasmic component [Caballeronia sordidicola]
MKAIHALVRLAACAAFVTVSAAANTSQAATLTVTHWIDGMYGVPFAVALDKGYFKQNGVDVTGFITSEGGGTSVRNAMASEIPYGEVALPAAIAAIRQGVPITIVHSGVQSVADLLWVELKDGNVNGIAQMKGKTIGYSSPKSMTEMITIVGLDRAGLSGQVQRKPVGASGTMMIALQQHAVDVAYMTEPSFSARKDQLRIAFRSTDIVPAETQTVGVVRTDYLKAHPDTVKAIIDARSKGVRYIIAHREESAQILAKAYKIDPAVAKSAIDNCLDTDPSYWSTGRFNYTSMDEVVKGLVLIKAIEPGPFDWKKIVDESMLPASERTK